MPLSEESVECLLGDHSRLSTEAAEALALGKKLTAEAQSIAVLLKLNGVDVKAPIAEYIGAQVGLFQPVAEGPVQLDDKELHDRILTEVRKRTGGYKASELFARLQQTVRDDDGNLKQRVLDTMNEMRAAGQLVLAKGTSKRLVVRELEAPAPDGEEDPF